MKKFILGLSLIAIIFASCAEPGSVYTPTVDELKINGKEYKVRHVTLSSGGTGIYLLIPKDTSVAVPISVNWSETQGKSTVQKATFVVE